MQTEESELPSGCLFKSWIPGGDHGGSNCWPCCVMSCFGAQFSSWGGEGGSVGLVAVMERARGIEGAQRGQAGWMPRTLTATARTECCVPSPHHSYVEAGTPSAMESGDCDGVMRLEPYEWDYREDLSELPCPPMCGHGCLPT